MAIHIEKIRRHIVSAARIGITETKNLNPNSDNKRSLSYILPFILTMQQKT